MNISKFYDTSKIYPELILLDYNVIKDELMNNPLWSEWSERYLLSNNTDKWTAIPIYSFEKWSEESTQFPKLTRILKNLKGLRTAGFSRLGPGTVLKMHRGFAELSNYVLRSHLGIDVPGVDKCGIRVENYRCYAKNGHWMTFDDSFEHSGFNSSDKDRIILLIDLERPTHIPKGTSTVVFTKELVDHMN
jgi:aspartyl/asparaginyl beta-hydroxylase (cupin superfamily)